MSTPRALSTSCLLAAVVLGTAVVGAQDSPEVGFVLGPPGADISVIAFTDFGCSACAQFSVGTFPALAAEFIEPGTVRWEVVPVALGFRHSKKALTAALCADRQGAFWPMHELLYARQNVWQKPRNPRAAFQGLALDVGIDTVAFAACCESGRFDRRIKQLTKRGRQHGIRGTPAFLVGERWIYGAQPLRVFRAVLSQPNTAPAKRD